MEITKFQLEEYDPSKPNDTQLADDWRLTCAKFSTMKGGGNTEFASIEDVEKFAAKLLAEILRRGKITFHPENTKEQSLILLGKSLTILIKGGLYLTEPHGELLYDGKKTTIVKSREFKRLQDFNILISGSKAYGFIRFKQPETIGLDEFKKREAEHKISEEERAKWWPSKTELFLSSIRDFVKYDKPRTVKPTTGAQVFIDRVEFAKRDDSIVVIPGFICQVGSSVGEEKPEDRDILFRMDACEHNESLRESLLLLMRKHLDPDKKDLPLHYIFNASGPHDDYLPLFDLRLEPLKAKVIEVKKADSLKLTFIGTGAMNSPRKDECLLVEAEGVKVLIDAGPDIKSSDIPGKLDAILVCDPEAKGDAKRLGEQFKLEPRVAKLTKGKLTIEPFDVKHTSHKTYAYKISCYGNKIIYAPEFWETPEELKDADLAILEASGWARNIAFAEGAGGHRAVQKTLEDIKDWNIKRVLWTHIGKTTEVAIEAGKPKGLEFAKDGQVIELKAKIEKAITPGKRFNVMKPAMAGTTDFFNTDELWAEWAKEKLEKHKLVGQVKYDGFRCVISKNGKVSAWFEDSKEDRTDALPDIVEAVKGLPSFVIDCEITAEKDGKPIPRTQLMTLLAGKLEATPIAHIFDCMYWDGEDLSEKPYSERYEFVKKFINEV